MKGNRIGFFGGCFNPPSNIHINLANKLIQENKLDKVVFVPVGDYYDKDELASAKHRYNMLNLAIYGYDNLEVSDIELGINKKLYASDAFELIAGKYIGQDIYFIMGSDNYSKMPKWKDYDHIKDRYKYIVLDRIDSAVSSSKIREMIRDGIDVSNLLNADVYEYLYKNKLYR
ncbi:MAG: nicotinate-nicotinamide nucleotide adenylyltransferase [Firmicutes bacterium]|nr:nicotinate-nicotinamide nucleotide adenylyltransferase [Bacillota bacterium]